LLKSYSTACGQDTARDAVQIFGGRGITQTGMGKYIEHVSIPDRLAGYVLINVTSIIAQSRSMHFWEGLRMFWQILVFVKPLEQCQKMSVYRR